MYVEDALRFVEAVLAKQGKRLNDVQRAVFRGSWLGKSYKEIRRDCPSCSLDYIMRDVGPELWNLLEATFGEEVTKKSLHGPIERAASNQELPPENNLEQGKDREEMDRSQPPRLPPPLSDRSPPETDDYFWKLQNTREDWGNAPDVSLFHGRHRELAQLEQWIRLEGCRLLVLCGIGGVGKTDLSVRLAQRVRDQFECLVWRSLGNGRSPNRPPTLEELLTDLIGVLSNQQDNRSDLSRLLYYLNHYSCLIVLDGFESVLRSGVHDGSYRQGYEDYSEFLREVGRIRRSCVLLTSREKPKEVARMEGEANPVRSRKLAGLGELGGQEIFVAKGNFSGSEGDWGTLIRRYAGNPLALKVVATRVLEVFEGEITQFLGHLGQDSPVFGDIRDVLDQQFQRLSDLERTIIHRLATHPEPIAVELLPSLVQTSGMQLQEGLESLLRRSLIEVDSARCLLQPLMLEYVTEQIERTGQ
ncbi:hypothetical protein K9N68_23015 [Kovacikia minuta CCNUW1]|uniref:hypothetical protein n=1 Tax=Kovacikia minuta TaxID=2931930 RepID=UPI001CCFD67F|nr:hypothetical protein [Kovacikia minuta]UBF24542.1 hypothetical protein K9N68_23015 [Kovacikia minuta CCNUW1]